MINLLYPGGVGVSWKLTRRNTVGPSLLYLFALAFAGAFFAGTSLASASRVSR